MIYNVGGAKHIETLHSPWTSNFARFDLYIIVRVPKKSIGTHPKWINNLGLSLSLDVARTLLKGLGLHKESTCKRS